MGPSTALRLSQPFASSCDRSNENFLDEGLSEFDFLGKRPAFLDSHLNDLRFGIEIRASTGAIPLETDVAPNFYPAAIGV
jgi:hypothetical protein